MNDRPVVLVVDDRPENLLTIEAILEPLDVTIHKALRADAALLFLLHNDPAVILLDVEMPEMDGFQTARLIRQRPRSYNTPIIFVTAVDRGTDTIREGYELGAVDYLVKPFQPDILRWKVSVFAELHRSRQLERLLIEEQNARAEVEAAERRARLLANVNVPIASNVDRDAILERLVGGLVPDFADCSVIFRRDQEDTIRFRSVSARVADDSFGEERVLDYQKGDPVFNAFRRQTPVLVDNLAENTYRLLTRAHRDLVERLHLQSGVFLPVQCGSHTIGVVGLYRRAPHAFSTSEFLFVNELRARIALVIANIHLYQESQEANRVKDQFLATVSHELRTPLVSISGWTNILLSRQMPPEAVEKALRTIQRNAKLQSDLVADILDFSCIDTARFSIKFENADLKTILEESVEAIRPLAEAKGIQLLTEISENAPIVLGDPNRLHQLFSNILSNAIKFTRESGRVTIRLESTDQAAQVQIADTGIGIEPEFLPRMFDPFVQADSSNTRSYPGLGLGLAIVRHIVNLHHGNIRAESAGRGQGATFTITLPVGFARSRAS
jgi:signal transduction histidine kinase